MDIGCAKGFLIIDLLIVCHGLIVTGIDISMDAVSYCEPEVSRNFLVGNAASLPFPSNYFRATITINKIHNMEKDLCLQAIHDMQRVAPSGGYIQVDSYCTPEERGSFLKWVLTAKTHYDPTGWKQLFTEAGYTGDYYWMTTE